MILQRNVFRKKRIPVCRRIGLVLAPFPPILTQSSRDTTASFLTNPLIYIYIKPFT